MTSCTGTREPVSGPPTQDDRPRLRPLLAVAVTVPLLAICVARWPPSYPMADLRVYRAGAAALVGGEDIYTAHLSHEGMALGFTYPPFAAIFFAPLAVLNEPLGRLCMTIASAIAVMVVGWLLASRLRPAWSPRRQLLAGVALALAGLTLEPVHATFGSGQVNLLLMAMILSDLLRATPRRLRGVLIGVATGIKLTPGIFIVYLLVTRRFRMAGIAIGSTIGTMLIGLFVAPGPSIDYWTRLIFDSGRVGPGHYISNQSLRGTLSRLTGAADGSDAAWAILAVSTVIAGLAFASWASRRGDHVLGIVLTALTGLLVSPVSWTNHWVWVLPATALLWSRLLSDAPEHAVIRPAREACRFAFVAAWTSTMVHGLPWLAPSTADRELHMHGADIMLGNAYTLAAVAFILLTPLLASVPSSMRTLHAPATGSSP